jgi:hypothetical protein
MTTVSSESVCRVARSWVEVDSFYKRLVVRFMNLQRQYVLFWTDLCESLGETAVFSSVLPFMGNRSTEENHEIFRVY